jgi:hypothetical protein
MSNTEVILSEEMPYTCVSKVIQTAWNDEYGPMFANVPVCGKILINNSREIKYDYNKFSQANYENKEILDTILNSFKSPEEIPEKIYGSLEIYFRKNPEEKLEKYSVKISNKIYTEVDGNYLKFILQFICVLFENNFFDDSFVMIERAILNVHTKNYNCTENYVPDSEDEEYITIIYNVDDTIGYELRFKEIIVDRGNEMTHGKIEKIYIDNETNSMQMFVSQLSNERLSCISVPIDIF